MKSPSNRRRTQVWGLPVALLLLGGCDVLRGPAAPAVTEILWDRYGVPHIYGSTPDELFFAFGWAQMAAHGDLLLELYGTSRGRAAEYWGPDHLPSDRRVHSLALPAAARAWFEGESPEMRGLLDSFARGANAFAEANPEALGPAAGAVLPIEAEDPLRHVVRVVTLDFVLKK